MAMVGLSVNAQSWTAPTITSETPVSGETYKLYNVGGKKYLAEGKSWFWWSTTAVLADNGSDFTFTGDASSFTLTTHRDGNNKVFTSGNDIPGDAMHVDGSGATNYGYNLMTNGYYRIHDAGGNEESPCWGYILHNEIWGVVAHADASTIADNGDWAFVNEASVEKFEARKRLYNALNQADANGISTSSAEVVYNNPSATVVELNEQVVALNVAIVNAFINGGTGVDLTSFVANADFEAGSLTGWTSIDAGGHLAGNKNFSLMKGNDYVEQWRGDGVGLGNGSLTHDAIGLPAGVYRISADAQNVEQYNGNVGGTGLFLYANDDKVEIGSAANYSVYTTLAADGPMTIKFALESCTGNWISYDNIKLTYFKQASDFLTFAVDAADAALADAAYANVIGDERNALIAVKNTPAAGSTLADYQDAANNIYAAIDAFKAAASSYNAYATYKAETVALFGTDFGVSTPTTAAEAVAAVAALNVAQGAEVDANYTYSLNGIIGDFGTWEGTATVEGNAAKANFLNWEHWSGAEHAYYEQASNGWGSNAWTIQYQKTCKLPAGDYVLKVAARSSAGVTSMVSCSAIPTTIALPSAGNNTRGINTSGVASWDDGDEFANTGNYAEHPATVGGTGTGWQWRFLPFTLTEKTEITMTFYAEANSKYQWMSISDGELLSKNDVTVKLNYDEEKSNTVKDEDVADVNVFRAIYEGYNTVVLPFNLTANQVTEAFGKGSVVYNFSENSDDPEKVTVNFKKGDGSITANVPVLVKATQDSGELEFKGLKIEAPTNDLTVEGKNVDFVGTYKPISKIAAGDYFIGYNKLYKSEGNTSINAFRAYLKVKAAAARVDLYIDGIATGIEAINADMSKSSDAIYNLNGQRVQKAQRGLYIMDGKKVLVK